MKKVLITAAILATSVLVSGSFAADKSIRLGGHLSLGYGFVSGVDEHVVLSKSLVNENGFISKNVSNNIEGADDLSGFGFELGGSVMLPLTDYISIRGNLLLAYRMHSATLTYDEASQEIQHDLFNDKDVAKQINHKRTTLGERSFDQFSLDIPVLCRMLLPTGDESGFYAEAGLVFSINMSTSTDISTSTDMLTNPNAPLVQNNTFTMGISVGAGRPLPFENVPVDVDIHLVFGVMSMANDEKFNPRDISIRVGATYWFL